jgi:hypothetical protein
MSQHAVEQALSALFGFLVTWWILLLIFGSLNGFLAWLSRSCFSSYLDDDLLPISRNRS